MYEAVYAHPDGESTIARMASVAAEYGYDGIVIRSSKDESVAADTTRASDAYDVDVVAGLEIDVEAPRTLNTAVNAARSTVPIVLVRGGSPERNRTAVETDAVDVLTQPMSDRGGMNHVLAKAAAENGVRIEFDLSAVLRSSGGRRVRAIQGINALKRLVDHYDVPYVVSGRPRSHLEYRSVRALRAVGSELGLSESWIDTGLAEWERLVERNRRVQTDSFIEPGVERGRYETDR